MRNRFSNKHKKDRSLVFSLLLPVVFFVFIVAIFNWGMQGLSRSAQLEQLQGTQQALVNSVVQCYAVEGQYPPNVEYLEEHYGLSIDRDIYIIHYNAFAANILPDMRVLPKNAFSDADTDSRE